MQLIDQNARKHLGICRAKWTRLLPFNPLQYSLTLGVSNLKSSETTHLPSSGIFLFYEPSAFKREFQRKMRYSEEFVVMSPQ